ncbi:type I restriction endonuclease subunit R [Endozoicomonas sp. SM1973]|uniref:Type I restriction endonuclease subunit R n=1 Tax=Spartinivicinus marinus TaxID=2994442 RepID=A0A853IHQ7_9GAMM|nr:type I restriction endonuclease subunit R [Spartinivicinus marinus]MCX4028618.1 type I restriction endonuclease subunit R [Spartinivicinus marinus]NYZ67116.1 type I restriction endonuclease subunit R [Spartinivicinus marinus]
MVSNTSEQALEAAIEKYLTGSCLEERKKGVSDVVVDLHNRRFQTGLSVDFDSQYAIDKRYFWQFLEATQAEKLEKLKRAVSTNFANDWQRKLLERFDRLVKKHGILHLLKKGFDVDDAHFKLFYPAPVASSSDKAKQLFTANVFSCTRQVHYSQANPLQSIDMVLFINGIPLITLELKNAWTGQTARYHGQKQYRENRDINQPLLNFGRCLVHMAVDTDEVYMTTKLAGKSTFFLPFNQGYNWGQGNPPNPSGHKTTYLWEEVFTKESLANIIQHFVRLDGNRKDPLNKRTLFFPRYHQLDVVRKLVNHASTFGVGKTYLIQHSAGSGKSNSITWAAFQLIETYPANPHVAGAKGMEQPLFDSVIVVTDRRLLDKQLRDNIKEFSEVKNIIAHAHKSSELKKALEGRKKIIITTIQKFHHILDGISDLSDKQFAVIIDEAHSSQSGSSHDNMNRAIGSNGANKGQEQEEVEDTQDKILRAMRSRKMRGNASYLAFTATPKKSTLEKFGEPLEDESYEPFHLYSMKQAIEEGFILDVLVNYTTYKSYYEIEKSIVENPQFESKKAQKKLRAYVERSQQTIDIKAEVMLEHFIPHVVNAKKLKGKAKGMVVTQNIEAAIRYHKAITRLLEKQGNPFKAAIAFSESKTVDGIDYTESGINGFAETETKDKFDTDDYRLLVVANKYLTGFDQPKLCAMYVDKKLADVLCVQTLSRLNRSAPKLSKKTEDLFILDFFNSVDDIKEAFDPFYTSTTLSKATDVNVLHELKDALDEVGVYEWYEVEEFITRFFDNEDAQTLSPVIDIAVARFDTELELESIEQADFKVKAKQFVKVYGQMASIMPYEIVDWEKLYWFLKFLIPKLKLDNPDDDLLDELLNSVDLSSYGLQREKLNHSIELEAAESQLEPQSANPHSAYVSEKETNSLDEIIKNFNERWFQGWSTTPEEQKVKFVNIADSVKKHPDFEAKYKNNPDPYNRELVFERILQDIMLKRRKEEMDLYRLFSSDEAFKSAWSQSIQREVDET